MRKEDGKGERAGAVTRLKMRLVREHEREQEGQDSAPEQLKMATSSSVAGAAWTPRVGACLYLQALPVAPLPNCDDQKSL